MEREGLHTLRVDRRGQAVEGQQVRQPAGAQDSDFSSEAPTGATEQGDLS